MAVRRIEYKKPLECKHTWSRSSHNYQDTPGCKSTVTALVYCHGCGTVESIMAKARNFFEAGAITRKFWNDHGIENNETRGDI